MLEQVFFLLLLILQKVPENFSIVCFDWKSCIQKNPFVIHNSTV